MNCLRCGASNDPTARFCTQCSNPLAAGADDDDATVAIPVPRQAAAKSSDDDPDATVAMAAPALRSRAGTGAWLPWAAGGVVLALAAAWTATRWIGEDAPKTVAEPAAPAASAVVAAAPASAVEDPEPAPRRPAELTQAINAGLQRLGFGQASVEVSDDRIATVRGTVASVQDRDHLLQMVRTVDGINGVRDALQLRAPPVAQAAPVPRAVVRVPTPAPTVEPTVVAKAPPVAPPPVAESVFDPVQATRQIQHSLGELALPGVTVQVDETQATLRGTVNDTAKKTQAIAAARRFAPQGRVRDLIFVVEE